MAGGLETASYEATADYVAEAIRSLGYGDANPVCLVGHSIGGQIGMYVASQHPGLVAKLALVNSVALRTHRGMKPRGLAIFVARMVHKW
jgi:pimeloyl-ACP methyl ester carboxylesterase